MKKESVKALPGGFSAAVKDIKLAILQACAHAARASNVESAVALATVGLFNLTDGVLLFVLPEA